MADEQAVNPPGEAGGDTPQSGGDETVALRAQLADMQRKLDTLTKGDAEEAARRMEFDATARAATQIIRAMPDSEPVKKEREGVRLAAAIVAERERRLRVDEEARLKEGNASVARQRDQYIEGRGKELGLTADEIELVKAAARDRKAPDTDSVDKMLAPFESRAANRGAERRTPQIARVNTDSGQASGGATKTYEDILRDYEERQRQGDRSATIMNARLEASRLGLLPRRIGA